MRPPFFAPRGSAAVAKSTGRRRQALPMTVIAALTPCLYVARLRVFCVVLRVG